MLEQNKKKILWILLSIVVLAATFIVYNYITRPLLPLEGPGGKDNLIDISKVQIYWNDKNVTPMLSDDSTILSQSIKLLPISTLDTANVMENGVFKRPPQDIWNVASIDTPIGDDYKMGDAFIAIEKGRHFGFLWAITDGVTIYAQDGLEIQTTNTAYARNGKEIVKLTFWGLDDDALAGINSDGVVLAIQTTGEHKLYCNIEDNCGVVTMSGLGFKVS